MKPPTSPILTIGGSQNKASDSSTTPEVAHEVATEVALEVAPEVAHEVATEVALEVASEVVRETTTAAITVAKIEETGEFYTSESEEHGTKPEKGKCNDDGFKWGVQEAPTFEELNQRISTTPVLSLPDFN
ncbi:hypothetical protein Tco_0395950, partial [Tanacetum coccineum]